MAHLELVPKKHVSSFRKLSIGSWETAYDPTVYGTLTVRMDGALAYMEAYQARTGVKLTVTHLVLKALAEALRRCPDANAVLRFGRIYLRQRVTVSALVARPGGRGTRLVPVRVEGAGRGSSPCGWRTRTGRVCGSWRRSWTRRCARTRTRSVAGAWWSACPRRCSTSSRGRCRSSR